MEVKVTVQTLRNVIQDFAAENAELRIQVQILVDEIERMRKESTKEEAPDGND